jgi:hypothetical protein
MAGLDLRNKIVVEPDRSGYFREASRHRRYSPRVSGIRGVRHKLLVFLENRRCSRLTPHLRVVCGAARPFLEGAAF